MRFLFFHQAEPLAPKGGRAQAGRRQTDEWRILTQEMSK
jgi:hypothetical protein